MLRSAVYLHTKEANMYTIKVDTSLLDEIAREYDSISECLFYAFESVKAAANIIDEFKGFGIELIAEQLYDEVINIRSVGEKAAEMRRKTERISSIYGNAESAVEQDVNNLPVLVHNNIAVVRNASEIINNIFTDNDISHNVTESALLCDNTVMHEDWLIKLIAKNKFGGLFL